MMMKLSNTISVLIFLVFLHIKGTQCTARNLKLFEFQSEKSQTPSPSPQPPNSPKQDGKTFYPIGYGADPTGKEDSSAAILAALNDAMKMKNGQELLPGINDLGGPVIDLQGENFTISKPIRFPPNIGNLQIKSGTLRASEKFPGDRHIIELGDPQNGSNKGMKYENVTFTDLVFDSSFRGGGLLVMDATRVRITGCFFVLFSTEGIFVQRGQETFITRSFLGEKPTVDENSYSATPAIDITGSDNSIVDVAFTFVGVGIVLRGDATFKLT